MPMLTLQGVVLAALAAGLVGYAVCRIVGMFRGQPLPPETYNMKYKAEGILSTLYQTGQQNLISFKDSQWSITNYTLLAIAAVVTVEQVLSKNAVLSHLIRYIGCFLVGLVACIGTVFVTDLQLGIRNNRVAINQIKKALFPSRIPGYPELAPATELNDRRFFRHAEIPIIYYASVAMGLAASITLIVST